MQRTRFLTHLFAAAGCCAASAAPAFAAGISEPQIGNQVYGDLRESGDIIFDSPFYEHLNEVGEIIAAAVRNRYEYPLRFLIVKGDSPNAFSVPGGFIYVNEPLIQLTRNRDELGGVLSHESGHMVLHHVMKRIKNAETSNLIGTIGSIVGSIFLGPLASAGAQYVMGEAAGAQDLNLSRHIEAQADEEGAHIAAATGVLNPWGLVWFFKILQSKYGDKGAFWERDHPFDSARIADLEKLFAANPQTFGKFTDTKAENEVYW